MADRWADSFEAFLSDMGPRPSPRHSIDRYPDPNGNYEPGNCRWATHGEQHRNLRHNVKVGDKIMVDEADRLGIHRATVMNRIRAGWPESDWLLPAGAGFARRHQ